MIENKLAVEIIAHKKSGETTVISLCGAADLGKSHLSSKLTELLNHKKLSTNHLALDSYLMKREIRNELGLSGYEIGAYNQKDALQDLIDLKNGKSIDYSPYDHKKGNVSLQKSKMEAADFLIFDGLHSMHSSFQPFIDMNIFIYTQDNLLRKIRSDADIIKRGYTFDYSKSISDKEFNLYKSNIEPYKDKADSILFLKEKWNYQLE